MEVEQIIDANLNVETHLINNNQKEKECSTSAFEYGQPTVSAASGGCHARKIPSAVLKDQNCFPTTTTAATTSTKPFVFEIHLDFPVEDLVFGDDDNGDNIECDKGRDDDDQGDDDNEHRNCLSFERRQKKKTPSARSGPRCSRRQQLLASSRGEPRDEQDAKIQHEDEDEKMQMNGLFSSSTSASTSSGEGGSNTNSRQKDAASGSENADPLHADDIIRNIDTTNDQRSVAMSDTDHYMDRACSPAAAMIGAEAAAARIRSGSLSDLFSTGWLSSSFEDNLINSGYSRDKDISIGAGARHSGDGDDEDSVSSSNSGHYYDPRDLNPGDWVKAMDATTVGFAVVALATVVTHPVLFLCGALTAIGTVSAAGAGYDYFNPNAAVVSDHASSSMTPFWSRWLMLWNANNIMATTASLSEEAAAVCGSTNRHKSDGRPITKENTTTESTQQNDEQTRAQTSTHTDELKPCEQRLQAGSTTVDQDAPASAGDKQDVFFSSDADTTVTEQLQEKLPTSAQCALHVPIANIPSNLAYPSKSLASNSDGGARGASVASPSSSLSWLNHHYPPLETSLVIDELFVGLSAIEFFHIFFDDTAPYNFYEFQKKRGDIDIKYRPWQDLLDQRRNSNSTNPTSLLSPLSLHPTAKTTIHDLMNEPSHGNGVYSFRERVLTFKAKTNAFFGPPYASTTKTQRILIGSKKWAVLESKTLLGDIPFCDRFFVMERWVIRASKNLETSIYSCRISSSCEVFFTKPCPFETQIRPKSCAAINDVCTAWCAMAKEALRLAEEAKCERLMRQHSSHLNLLQPVSEECEGAGSSSFGGTNACGSKNNTKSFEHIESIEVEHDGDLGIVSLRRSDSKPELSCRVSYQKLLIGGGPVQPSGIRRLRRSLSQISGHMGQRLRSFSNTSASSWTRRQQSSSSSSSIIRNGNNQRSNQKKQSVQNVD